MSRRKTPEELDAEAEAEDQANADRWTLQRECGHYDCQPTEWYWSGQIRNMHCNDCELDEFRDEVDT